MNNQNLMSENEIHEFGINIVLDDIRKRGFTILSITTDITQNPQIIAKEKGHQANILVRTAMYPKKGTLESISIASNVIKISMLNKATCYFASVGLASADGVTDLEMSIPIKGGGYYVAYEGLVELKYTNLISFLSTNESVTTNRDGQIAGSTRRMPDGRHTIVANENSDGSSLLMSICQIFADDLNVEQKEIFSKWAELPTNLWSQTHRDAFALALMHFFMEEKEKTENLPESLKKGLKAFPPQVLKPLKQPLTPEIKNLCASLFSA